MNMIWKATSICAALSLSACAAPGPVKPITPAPVCSIQAQCTAEWAEARTFVLNNAGFKIQTYSRDFFQTYNATGDSASLAASVNKQPLAGGAYKIVASFWCDNIFGCIPNQRTTLDQFNRAVAAAGAHDTSLPSGR